MSARTLILNGLLQGNLDCAGFKLLNVKLDDITVTGPFVDNVALLFNAVDPTKLVRFNLSGQTTGTTRVLTPPNYNGTLATLSGTEDLTNKTYNGYTLTGNGGLNFTDGVLRLSNEFIVNSTVSLTLNTTAETILTLPTSGTLTTLTNTERPLGNPSVTGYVLSSTTGGVRSWVPNAVTGQPFSDLGALIKNNGDPTKLAKFSIGGFTTGTTRTFMLPNYDGMIALQSDVIPAASLSTDQNLSPQSDTLVPSQRAVYEYYKARLGAGVKGISDDSISSATSLDVTATPGPQIAITGTTDIEEIVIDEGDERVLVAGGAFNLIQSSNLLIPGGVDRPLSVGDYFVVQGGAAGVVTVTKVQKASATPQSTVADINGGTLYNVAISTCSIEDATFVDTPLFPGGAPFYGATLNVKGGLSNQGELIIQSGGSPRTISVVGGDLNIAGAFSTIGAFALTLTTTAATALTLPTTGTVEAYVGVPASAAASGVAGQKAYDASFEYRCISANTWKRAAISTW